MAITVCSHCGTANRAGSNFCNSCGTDLRQAGRDSARPPEQTSSPPRSSTTAAATTASASSDEMPTGEETSTAATNDESGTPESSAPVTAFESAPPVESILPEQPWLRIEFDVENDIDLIDSASSQDRLIIGLQGLLEPVRISSRRQPTSPGDDEDANRDTDTDIQTTQDSASSTLSAPQSRLPFWHNLTPERQRTLRRLMSEQPIVRNSNRRAEVMRAPRVPWIILLLGLAVTIPAFMQVSHPESAPMQWSGVQDAFLAIENLPTESPVLVYWAYDPATAGELDLPTLAVTGHLLDRHASMMMVTPLALGPPAARRLSERALTQRGRYQDLLLIANLTWKPPIQFLPGGIAVLPLVGQSLEQVLSTPLTPPSPELRFVLDQPQALHVLFAARAEDVQDWLEQVHPFTNTPVIAVTSAAADPLLRPYLDTGQLRGLVSGFDGATQYQTLVDQAYRRNDTVTFQRHAILQNWGHMAILAIILIGNVASFFASKGSERDGRH